MPRAKVISSVRTYSPLHEKRLSLSSFRRFLTNILELSFLHSDIEHQPVVTFLAHLLFFTISFAGEIRGRGCEPLGNVLPGE